MGISRKSLAAFAWPLLAVGLLIYAWLQGRPHQYPDAPAGEFACLSYTPRSGTGIADIHAQIDRDLQQLVQRTHCVRTYSVSNGLDYVPEAARKLGMRVLLGIWIGSNLEANEQEIAQAIKTANAHRDVIDAIVVGNEVLLRREQSADVLYGLLQQVRAATQLPVTYADVWDFWLKNPKLAEVSDFISIHILPYWDDEPVDIDHALEHVENIYAQVRQKFPGRRIYVGETGWPSEGRQREGAKPSVLNQARFTREFIAFASANNIPYNFIEAYDQPWKKRLEGTVGGYWGLYDATGQEKFPLAGQVVADAQWWRGPLLGLICSALTWICLRRISRQNLPACIYAGFCFGAALLWQSDYAWRSNRNWQEWLGLSSWALIGHAAFISIMYSLCVGSSSNREHPDHPSQKFIYSRIDNGLLLALIFGASYINLGLIFDARYRDFPSLFILLPTIALLLRRYCARMPPNGGIESTLLCSWLLLSAPIIVLNEGFNNLNACLWSALCLLLSGSLLPALQSTRPQQHAQQ
ncbi:MAG: hypothetical protein QM808_07390 [Steroidobacteraceae bacterium]